MGKISIITPCYNSEKFLRETIISVLNQSYTNWEWVITDDCSLDKSIKIIEEYLYDSRIKLIKLTKNQGARFAYNSSLEKATGRYVTFIDSDDTWDSDFLEKMIHAMIENKFDMIYSGYRRLDEEMKPKLSDFKANKIVTFQSLLYTCPLSTLSTMYDSQKCGKVLMLYDNKREDLSMWLSVLKILKECHPIDFVKSNYRIHSGSLSRNKREMMKCQYQLYREFLNYSVVKSLYYTFFWAINGIAKYSF